MLDFNQPPSNYQAKSLWTELLPTPLLTPVITSPATTHTKAIQNKVRYLFQFVQTCFFSSTVYMLHFFRERLYGNSWTVRASCQKVGQASSSMLGWQTAALKTDVLSKIEPVWFTAQCGDMTHDVLTRMQRLKPGQRKKHEHTKTCKNPVIVLCAKQVQVLRSSIFSSL